MTETPPLEDEIWLPIIGYEGLYDVSSLGRVKSLCFHGKKRTMILRGLDNKLLYKHVILYKQGIPKSHLIHRLIATNFIPNIEKKKTVNHKNGIRYDNRVENLERMTPSENCTHGYRSNGRKNPLTGQIGILHPLSKKIIQYTKDNVFIKIRDSGMDITRELGFSQCNISSCCSGRQKTSKGYIWKHL